MIQKLSQVHKELHNHLNLCEKSDPKGQGQGH